MQPMTGVLPALELAHRVGYTQRSMEMKNFVPGYRTLKSVGSGAAATIYLAESPSGEQVALKVVSVSQPGGQKAGAELRQEYKILACLDHPGIPRAHALHELSEGVCMVREYCGGTSLRKLMREEPGRVNLMLGQVLGISGQILQHMHDRGIIHRDFKPENLIIDDEGGVSLVDMALAWRKRLLTSKPSLAGTPAYLAPELLEGQAPTPASDAYSYAATAYDLMAGRPPYEGGSRDEVLRALQQGGAPGPKSRNKSISPELDHLVMQGLSRQPAERPSNLTVYGHRLASTVAAAGLVSPPR